MRKTKYSTLFSVVTICYNAENTIKKTIESVLAQDNTNFEYVIKDGGSSDRTLEIVNSYAPRFEEKGVSFVVYSEKDNGIYDAMNQGALISSSRYVIFMNSDDCFYSDSVLSSVAGKLKDCGYLPADLDVSRALDKEDFSYINFDLPDIIYGDCIVEELGMYFKFRKCFDLIKERMPFSHQACFCDRTLLIGSPFDTKYRITADYDFLLRSYVLRKTFFDCEIDIALVTADGLSSVNMLDTFVEVNEVCNVLGCPRFDEASYSKKLKEMKVKQFVLTYFPNFIKRIIRKNQIKKRGQITSVTLPPWCK